MGKKNSNLCRCGTNDIQLTRAECCSIKFSVPEFKLQNNAGVWQEGSKHWQGCCRKSFSSVCMYMSDFLESYLTSAPAYNSPNLQEGEGIAKTCLHPISKNIADDGAIFAPRIQ